MNPDKKNQNIINTIIEEAVVETPNLKTTFGKLLETGVLSEAIYATTNKKDFYEQSQRAGQALGLVANFAGTNVDIEATIERLATLRNRGYAEDVRVAKSKLFEGDFEEKKDLALRFVAKNISIKLRFSPEKNFPIELVNLLRPCLKVLNIGEEKDITYNEQIIYQYLNILYDRIDLMDQATVNNVI